MYSVIKFLGQGYGISNMILEIHKVKYSNVGQSPEPKKYAMVK